jgi:hypothetical protein
MTPVRQILLGVGRRLVDCARGRPGLSRSATWGWLPAGDMMVDGVLFPLGEALRPLGLCGPSTRTWRQQSVGSRPRCIGDR